MSQKFMQMSSCQINLQIYNHFSIYIEKRFHEVVDSLSSFGKWIGGDVVMSVFTLSHLWSRARAKAWWRELFARLNLVT